MSNDENPEHGRSESEQRAPDEAAYSLEPIKLSPELLAWARNQYSDEEILAGIEEIQRTGGLQQKDFLPELEALVNRAE